MRDNSTIFLRLGACPFPSLASLAMTQWSISQTTAYIKLCYIAEQVVNRFCLGWDIGEEPGQS